ncbi:MAG: glycosyltransferase family 2 protein [Thermoguttaceae bacterium]
MSIIIPCRNEATWIERCLASVDANDYPKTRLEVLVLDGQSDDGTRTTIEKLQSRYPYVRMMDNPQKIVPVALNLGIAAARGEIIMRLDAHYEYPANYISRLVEELEKSGADGVGGCLKMSPANHTTMARAIAAAVVHPFGIGNAHYRIGASEPCWVDTALFGCYRRDVFDRIGLYDEEMVRNQDIEFNRRLTGAGGKILLVPDVVLQGFARDSLSKLARMYFQYAYFNPLVIRKSGGRVTPRQIVTPVFVLSLATTMALSPWFWLARWLLAAILLAYSVPLTLTAFATARRHGVRCGLTMFVVIPAIHLSHGLGFLKGALDFFVLRKRVTVAKASAVSITR